MQNEAVSKDPDADVICELVEITWKLVSNVLLAGSQMIKKRQLIKQKSQQNWVFKFTKCQ